MSLPLRPTALLRRSALSRFTIALAVFVLGNLVVASAPAAVAVISNRTPEEIRFTVIENSAAPQPSQPKSYTVLAGDITVVPLERGTPVRLATGNATYALQADAAYFFGSLPSGKADLQQIGLPGMPPPEAGPKFGVSPASMGRTPEADEAARTITVKIFVDDDEPANRAVWEHRFRERIAAASDILERTCGIKLKIIGSDTWHLRTTGTDFDTAVEDFVKTVDPGEARLAIGFTGRYQNKPSGQMHMGGTRGALSRHLLVREWSRHFSESERLEFLLHELGHFLGAVHTPEKDTVMRPLLGDRQSRAKRFQIHFDPLNALAINLVADEIRNRQVQSFLELSPPTKARLRVIYEEINKALPNDPAAVQYLQMLGAAPRNISTGMP